MSNRTNYRHRRSRAHQREARRVASTTLAILRQVHGCTCDVWTRHRDGHVTFHHDDGCPLIGRSQIAIYPQDRGQHAGH